MRLTGGHFFGKMRGRRDVGGAIFTESAYPAHLRLHRHSHEHAYFSLVVRGSYTEQTARQRRECHAASVLFHPAGEAHQDSFGSRGGRVLGIELTAPLISRLPAGALSQEPHQWSRGAVVLSALKAYAEFRTPDSVADLALESIAMELVVGLARSRRAWAVPPWLETVHDLLQASYLQPLTMSAISREVGVSPSQIAYRFRRHYGCTVGDFVRRLRVDWAVEQLQTTGSSLAQIAAQGGFYDQSHLSRHIRRRTGMTPLRIRQLAAR